MRRLRRSTPTWSSFLALTIVGCFLVVAAAAPWIAPPEDPSKPASFKAVGESFDMVPHPPSDKALLGTTPRQFDIFYTLVWGTRSTLRFGLVVALTTALLGVLIGATSSYLGGQVNGLAMRMTDAFLTFPSIAAVWLFDQILRPLPGAQATTLQAMLQTLHVDATMLALIVFSWMPYARIINVQVAILKQTEYVMAARAVGVGGTRIILRHLLPNAIAPAIILAARDVGAMVIMQATFTFIGVGGGSEWGTLLVTGRNWIISGGGVLSYWWVFVPATLALILFGIGWNLLGDSLAALLNPRSLK